MGELTLFEKEFGLMENEEGKIVVSSRIIAEKYEKDHADVLKKISGFIKEIPDLERDGSFSLSSYQVETGNGTTREYKEYIMDRQGFSMLVNKFTGLKALHFTYRYTKAFEEMSKELKHRREQNEEVIHALSEKDEKIIRLKLLKSYFGKRKTVRTFKYCTFVEFNGLLEMFNEYVEKLPAKEKQREYSRFINGITQNRNSLSPNDRLFMPKVTTYSHYIQEFTEKKSKSENKSYGKRLGHKEKELEKYKQLLDVAE